MSGIHKYIHTPSSAVIQGFANSLFIPCLSTTVMKRGCGPGETTSEGCPRISSIEGSCSVDTPHRIPRIDRKNIKVQHLCHHSKWVGYNAATHVTVSKKWAYFNYYKFFEDRDSIIYLHIHISLHIMWYKWDLPTYLSKWIAVELWDIAYHLFVIFSQYHCSSFS